MNPDSPETRLGRLEQQMAKTEQRLDDHAIDIRAFAPLTASHAVLTQQMVDVQKTLEAVIRRMDVDQHDREARQADASKDSQQWRRTILLLGISSFVSILIAAVTIAATVLS